MAARGLYTHTVHAGGRQSVLPSWSEMTCESTTIGPWGAGREEGKRRGEEVHRSLCVWDEYPCSPGQFGMSVEAQWRTRSSKPEQTRSRQSTVIIAIVTYVRTGTAMHERIRGGRWPYREGASFRAGVAACQEGSRGVLPSCREEGPWACQAEGRPCLVAQRQNRLRMGAEGKWC